MTDTKAPQANPREFHVEQGEAAQGGRQFDFHAHLVRQRQWSEATFGPARRTEGLLNHIRKELDEIASDPLDIEEWIDLAILALDGAWRHGATPERIIATLAGKQAKNEARTWPDWRGVPESQPIEHVRVDGET